MDIKKHMFDNHVHNMYNEYIIPRLSELGATSEEMREILTLLRKYIIGTFDLSDLTKRVSQLREQLKQRKVEKYSNKPIGSLDQEEPLVIESIIMRSMTITTFKKVVQLNEEYREYILNTKDGTEDDKPKDEPRNVLIKVVDIETQIDPEIRREHEELYTNMLNEQKDKLLWMAQTMFKLFPKDMEYVKNKFQEYEDGPRLQKLAVDILNDDELRNKYIMTNEGDVIRSNEIKDM